MEARATDRTRDSLRGLLDLAAKDVAVLRTDAGSGATVEERIPVEDLAVGDRFVVRPGEKVATDGTVRDGRSALDASLVTGESQPVEVVPGTEVTGGTVNTTGRLVVEATRVGAETTLAGIARLVERAQTSKAPVQRLADRVSAVFVPVVLGLALLTFVGWWIGSGDPAPGPRGRGLGARHRLPLRARARHPHGAARRHWPGRAARHPHQGRRRQDTRRIDTVVLGGPARSRPAR